MLKPSELSARAVPMRHPTFNSSPSFVTAAASADDSVGIGIAIITSSNRCYHHRQQLLTSNDEDFDFSQEPLRQLLAVLVKLMVPPWSIECARLSSDRYPTRYLV